jgi:hypothetical protein
MKGEEVERRLKLLGDIRSEDGVASKSQVNILQN